MLESMSIHPRDSKWIIKSNFVTLCLAFRGSIPIAYASRQLKSFVRNYLTHDLEFTTVVFVLKTWRHYLYGKKFKVCSNHKSLKYIFSEDGWRHWKIMILPFITILERQIL